MVFIKNLLSVIGLLAIVLVVYAYSKYQPFIGLYQNIDPQTKSFAYEQMKKLAAMDENELQNYINQAKQLDPKAYDVYLQMADTLLKSGNAAEATVWKFPVNEDLSVDDVIETMKFVANERNISNVGELPLSKDITAKLGKEFRHVSLYLFCNSLTAAKMLEFSDSYSAYLPCRVALVEDMQGKLWIYSLNMDMMIHGGRPLPKKLLDEAMVVRETILEIMKRGAEGDF